MPAIITATQLRSVLGVDSALYSDAYLDQIIDSAENIILPMLVANVSGVNYVRRKDNVAFYQTVRPHGFVVGQTVIVTNVPSPLAASVTVTNDQTNDPYVFTAASSGSDIDEKPVIPTGIATLSGYSASELYANTPAVESAVYVVSTEIFQSRLSIGGQLEGVDFTPTPFRLGRSLLSRVSALLTPYLDVETIAQ